MPAEPENPFSGVAIDAEIARAWTLPARFYLNPAIAVLERERIFRREWQVVAHRSQLANPGDYLTTEIADEPVLVVCDAEGRLRAFYNVCRHRAGPPATGCGSRKVFRCGYHGWTYALDGSLISAPEFEDAQEFDPVRFSLVPIRVEEFFGFVFVNLDGDARPLAEKVHAIRETDGSQPLPLRLFERRTYEMKCNWKTYVDNYLEGYHLPSVHPGLNRELDYASYGVEVHERQVRQSSPIRKTDAGEMPRRRYSNPDENSVADYVWFFPNWMINRYPDSLSLNIVEPIDAGHSRAIFEWYVGQNEIASPAAKDPVEFSHQIQIEDIAICETVQKNLGSASYDRGRYSVRQERGVHAFHCMYMEAMTDELDGHG